MSRTFKVTFTVVAGEGFKDDFDPYCYKYDDVISFDDAFDAQGAEIMNIAIEEVPE